MSGQRNGWQGLRQLKLLAGARRILDRDVVRYRLVAQVLDVELGGRGGGPDGDASRS